jgi:hypothetical protein
LSLLIGTRVETLCATKEGTKMNCPHCNKEMKYEDYYGKGIPGNYDFIKDGDIYECDNDECEMYAENFHTDVDGNLYEGYPC